MPKWPPSSRRASTSASTGDVARPGTVARVLLVSLRAYRSLVSPFFPGACRFEPSCSRFASEAVELHGAAKGLGLAVRRLAHCHPWNAGGYDPVPPNRA